MKLFLFDLDGTLRQTKSGMTFINNPTDQQPTPGSQKALIYYTAKGFACHGITNQGGVAAGHKSLESAFMEQQITLSMFPQLQSILMCSDYDGKVCHRIYPGQDAFDISGKYPDLIGTYRKPFAGMANHLLISNEVAASECWMAGDRTEDMACAIAAGIRFVWADMMLSKFVPGMHESNTEGIDKQTILDFLAI